MNSSFAVCEETVDEPESSLSFYPYIDNGDIIVPEETDTSATTGSANTGKKVEGNDSVPMKDVVSSAVISNTESKTNYNMNSQTERKLLSSQLKIVPEDIDSSATTSSSIDEEKVERRSNSFPIKSSTVISNKDLQTESRTISNMKNQGERKPTSLQLKVVKYNQSVGKAENKTRYVIVKPQTLKPNENSNSVTSYTTTSDDPNARIETGYTTTSDDPNARIETGYTTTSDNPNARIETGYTTMSDNPNARIETGYNTTSDDPNARIETGYTTTSDNPNARIETGYTTTSDDPNVRIETGYPCLKCGVVASKESTAKLHDNAHKSEYLCSFCPQVFLKKHTADMHIKLHENGGVRQVYDTCQCKICGGSFIALMYLEFHVIEMHGEEILSNPKVIHFPNSNTDDGGGLKLNDSKRIKKYKCGTCNNLFNYPLNLDCHMEFHEESIYSCGFCKSSFTLLDDLLLHMKIHENKSLNVMFEEYMSNFDDCLMEGEDGNVQIQNSFEQVFEIEDRAPIEITSSDEPHFSGAKPKVSEEKTGSLKPHVKIRRNNIGRSTLKILNRKLITRKDALERNKKPNQTNYKIKTKNWIKRGKLIGQEYINPYLFHFLPNGKYSHYFDNMQKILIT